MNSENTTALRIKDLHQGSLNVDKTKFPDEVIKVDNDIAPVIQFLNRRKIITLWSCSGHYEKQDGYISILQKSITLKTLNKLKLKEINKKLANYNIIIEIDFSTNSYTNDTKTLYPVFVFRFFPTKIYDNKKSFEFDRTLFYKSLLTFFKTSLF
jgi:hypothetical protein